MRRRKFRSARADRGTDRRAQSRAARRPEARQQNSRAKAARLRAPRTAGRDVGARRCRRSGRRARWPAQQMSDASAAQAQQAAQAANSDFMAYQQNVVAQDNAATSSIARQLQAAGGAKISRQSRAAAAERDRSLACADAARCSIALGDQDAPLQSRDGSRCAQAGCRSSSPRSTRRRPRSSARSAMPTPRRCAAYRAQLDRQTSDAIRAQVGAIQSQTQGKLEEHRNEVGAQLRSLGPAADAGESPARRAGPDRADPSPVRRAVPSRRRQNDRGIQRDQEPISIGSLRRLHGADVGATGAAAKELGSLQKRRERALRADRRPGAARRLAHRQGPGIQHRLRQYSSCRGRLRSDQPSHQGRRKPTRVKSYKRISSPLDRGAARRLRGAQLHRAGRRAADRLELAGVSGLSNSDAGRRALDLVAEGEHGTKAARRIRSCSASIPRSPISFRSRSRDAAEKNRIAARQLKLVADARGHRLRRRRHHRATSRRRSISRRRRRPRRVRSRKP